MKIGNFNYLLVLIALSLMPIAIFFASCQISSRQKAEPIVVRESDLCKKTIGVDGMACVGCEVTIEEKLSKIEGVVSVKASRKANQVIVEFDSTKTDLNTIKSNIAESGYKLLKQ